MTDATTTALYLFSSLLQADAAILGFGAVFVVYRLQAAETERQRLEAQETPGKIPVTEEGWQKLRLPSAADYIPKVIKRLFWIPLSLLTLHISLCAILLWCSQSIGFATSFGGDLIGGTIGLFIVSVIVSSLFTWHLLSYDLRRAQIDSDAESKKLNERLGNLSTEELEKRISRKMQR